MTVTIKIECGNAAFENPGYELHRIMTDLGFRFQPCYTAENMKDNLDGLPIVDINGNKVGSVKVTGRRSA